MNRPTWTRTLAVTCTNTSSVEARLAFGSVCCFLETVAASLSIAFEDDTFSNLDRCVRRLTEKRASISTSTKKVERLLQLLIGPEHTAFDPRISRLRRTNLHTTCIKSIIDNAAPTHERRSISRIALRYALCHKGCPLSSIELLCEYGGASDTVEEAESTLPDLTGQCGTCGPRRGQPPDTPDESEEIIMHMTPLQVAVVFCANQAVTSTLLEHGANPKLLDEYERTFVISAGSREKSKKVALAKLSRAWLQNISLLPGLFRPKSSLYIEPRKIP